MSHNNKTVNYTDFFYYAFRNILLVSIPLVIISALVLSLPHSSADNSSLDNIMVSIPTACTLSATIDSEHSVNTLGGTYTDDIGETTMKTICNDANGFSIYTIGASRSNEGSTVLASSLGTDYDIITGTATSGNTSNWAMKLTTDSTATYPITLDSGFNTNNYVSVPSTWTKVAHRTSGTDTATEAEAITGASLSTTYAVYTTSAQPAGTYVGQVKYVLLHPNTNSNFMTLQMAFDEYVGPEHKIPLENSSDPNTPTYYRMQDMTNQICQTATAIGNGGQMQLIDDRTNLDGKKRLYWVAKLADGNCWMTQNLDLDLIANRTYTHSDTDLGWDPNSFDANATWTLTGGPSTISWDSSTSKFIGWQSSDTAPYSASKTDGIETSHVSTGNYYNWSASTAYNSSPSYTQATKSICPAGWRLPRHGTQEFAQLLIKYKVISNAYSNNYLSNGYNIIRNSPLYFTMSGQIGDNGALQSTGEGSYYNNTVEYSYGRFMKFNSVQVNATGGGNYKGSVGRSLRCLAR